MSDIFALGGMDTERSNREALIINSPDVPADLFDGADVTGSWGRGSSRLARAAALAGSVAPMAYDAVFDNGTEAQDWYFKNVVDDPYQSAQEYYAPDGKIVGAGGSVLNSVVEMLPQLVGGGASLTASTQLNTGIDLVNQGVDSMTAQGVGAIQGVAAGAGVWLPVIGKTAAQKVLFSAAANPAINAMARGASNVALESQGYTKQADNYDAFDLQSIAVDTLMGAVFGGVDVQLRGGEAATDWNVIPQSVKDSIVAAKAYIHRTVDSAPGKPMDIKAQNAHLDATDTAVSQMLEGKKVEVADKVAGVEFAPRAKPEIITDKLDIDDAVGVPYRVEPVDLPELKVAELTDDELSEIINNEFKYHRFTNSDTPESRAGYMLFADNAESVRFYGKNQYVFDEKISKDAKIVNADDPWLIDEIEKSLLKRPEITDDLQTDARSIAEESNPNDIVDSAQIWDNEDIVQIIYEDILEPNNITVVKTNNGVVVFDRQIVKSAKEAKKIIIEMNKTKPTESEIMSMDVQAVDPEISMARQSVEQYGDYEIEVSRSEPTMGGQVVVTKRKASEVIAEIESAYKTDTQIADAILAASNCFIGGM